MTCIHWSERISFLLLLHLSCWNVPLHSRGGGYQNNLAYIPRINSLIRVCWAMRKQPFRREEVEAWLQVFLISQHLVRVEKHQEGHSEKKSQLQTNTKQFLVFCSRMSAFVLAQTAGYKVAKLSVIKITQHTSDLVLVTMVIAEHLSWGWKRRKLQASVGSRISTMHQLCVRSFEWHLLFSGFSQEGFERISSSPTGVRRYLIRRICSSCRGNSYRDSFTKRQLN